MKIQTEEVEITIVDEPTYTFNSGDNAVLYAKEYQFAQYANASQHGIFINSIPAMIIG